MCMLSAQSTLTHVLPASACLPIYKRLANNAFCFCAVNVRIQFIRYFLNIFYWRTNANTYSIKTQQKGADMTNTTNRVYNFSAGPAMLPVPVLEQAASEMLDYGGTGTSVMEMSHRSKAFSQIIEDAEADLRNLMNIPDNYDVLFLQGGASQQFAAIPMNLSLPKNKVADYLVTGNWSNKAYQEAARFVDAKAIVNTKECSYTTIPDVSNLDIRDNADYVYICQNETVHGIRFAELPNTKGKVLVADQSSMFLSEPVDVEKYGLIYAGAQKNVGPAGVVILIVRHDLVPQEEIDGVPTMLEYKTQVDKKSLYNTPPCYGIYICGLVFKYLLKQGGLSAMKERNEKKAALLYDAIDNSNLFKGTVEPKYRSIMNVPFVTGNEELDAKFVAEAAAQGMVNLKGHRSVGGLRASIYNAMPEEGVKALVDFMHKFEKDNA